METNKQKLFHKGHIYRNLSFWFQCTAFLFAAAGLCVCAVPCCVSLCRTVCLCAGLCVSVPGCVSGKTKLTAFCALVASSLVSVRQHLTTDFSTTSLCGTGSLKQRHPTLEEQIMSTHIDCHFYFWLELCTFPLTYDWVLKDTFEFLLVFFSQKLSHSVNHQYKANKSIKQANVRIYTYLTKFISKERVDVPSVVEEGEVWAGQEP